MSDHVYWERDSKALQRRFAGKVAKLRAQGATVIEGSSLWLRLWDRTWRGR